MIKIFHDYCEDSAALHRHFGITAHRVFDTQIAHRLSKAQAGAYREADCCVSLANLMREHIPEAQDKLSTKDELKGKMAQDPAFWEKRPLSDMMKRYAADDVAHLPSLFLKLKHVEGVFEATQRYSAYPLINHA